ncbi:hypothetical protein MRB53_008532 [Persea americana]|uniref:Uncharacterized protein n=1 Tax=Persea americana TaxID=3435 RepID=A0ACC2MN67_PERAE|nr:hypothetical protein MRB53_008532 [Persea americana]
MEALKAIDIRNGSPAGLASSSKANPWFSQSEAPPMDNIQKNDYEGWIVKTDQQVAVLVAPWVVEEEKKALALCLVGFLKSTAAAGMTEVELWLANTWGGCPISMKRMDTDVVLLQLSSEEELEGIL